MPLHQGLITQRSEASKLAIKESAMMAMEDGFSMLYRNQYHRTVTKT